MVTLRKILSQRLFKRLSKNNTSPSQMTERKISKEPNVYWRNQSQNKVDSFFFNFYFQFTFLQSKKLSAEAEFCW